MVFVKPKKFYQSFIKNLNSFIKWVGGNFNPQKNTQKENFIMPRETVLINTTPHPIVIMDNNNNVIQTLSKSNLEIRIGTEEISGTVIKTSFIDFDGFEKPVGYNQSVQFVGQPEVYDADKNKTYTIEYAIGILEKTYKNKVTFVASMPTAMIAKREDVVCIDNPVRNEKGHTVGCKGFRSFI